MEKYQSINILYEDNHLLVVVKPKNIPVCPDSSCDKDLLTILKQYIKDKYQKPGNVYLGLIHRLDRPVSGIMVFAKTSKCAERLTRQIKENKFNKTYYAITEGTLKNKDTLTDYLVKDESTNTSHTTSYDHGKLSTLTYELISTKNNLNLVKIHLETGRHHQIRVQFSSRGNYLYGDHRYNPHVKKDDKSNIALIAKELSFYHPTKLELLTFSIPLPNTYPWSLFS